jgi:hypothetical protein
MHRPDPLRWLWYSLGGGLPPEYRDWVLHDVTCRSWALRQALRSLMVVAPLAAAVLIFVPGPFWIRAVSVLGGITMGLIYALGYLVETTEHRLVKAGYPVGTGERVREQRMTQARSEAVALRREKMFERMDRRRR